MTFDEISTNEWQALDSAHHMAPFTDYGDLRQKGARIITHAEGHYIYDSDGNRILDGMAGLWCVNVGYGRPELVEAAATQMAKLPYYNNFFRTSNQPVAELSAKLAEITPDGLSNVFYANSGSEANDTIIRMVRHYWALEGKPEKRVIISREFGYHGSTIMSASLGGLKGMHDQAANEPGFAHIRPPYGFLHQGNQDEAEFAANAASWLEDKIIEIGASNVAAFVAEPIQGAGGVIVPPAGYFKHIQEICRRHDILFVADEVITGFGRTGQWFASQTMELEPDMMALAKGLTSGYVPMSAVMVGDRVANKLVADGGEFYHGFTYSGHPVAAAVALANLELIEREDMITRVREDTGPYLAEALAPLAEHRIVGEIRTFGVLAAIELVKSKDGPEMFEDTGATGVICRDHAINRGLMMRAVRDAMILSPALTYSRADIDETVRIAAQALDATADQLGL
ncbi:MAG: aspartate aminotransferase family protein [Candidatus Puniceispirillaceae bacterium]|jgi:putrescine aminotransferase|tara:strand:- start:3529 stop:4896 length:1368 start_codon:yes stop_codon:yes gene_type:complete